MIYNVGSDLPRTELHDKLGLTGSEVSVNTLPAGAAVPFVHKHRQNEEVYGVLSGRGRVELAGVSYDIKEGDWFKVDPETPRRLFAAADASLRYICIQTKAGSLEAYTMGDGVVVD